MNVALLCNAQLDAMNPIIEAKPLKLSKCGYIVDYYFWDILVGDTPAERFEEMWDLIEVLYVNAGDFVKQYVSHVE